MKKIREQKRVIKRKHKLSNKYRRTCFRDEFSTMFKLDVEGKEYKPLSEFLRKNK